MEPVLDGPKGVHTLPCCAYALRAHNTLPATSSQVPDLVTEYMGGTTLLDKYVTHNLKFDQINEAFELLHSGESLRCVLTF